MHVSIYKVKHGAWRKKPNDSGNPFTLTRGPPSFNYPVKYINITTGWTGAKQ